MEEVVLRGRGNCGVCSTEGLGLEKWRARKVTVVLGGFGRCDDYV